jgi:hypothetical protein
MLGVFYARFHQILTKQRNGTMGHQDGTTTQVDRPSLIENSVKSDKES